MKRFSFSGAYRVNNTTRLQANITIETPTYSRKSSAMYSTATVYDMRPSAVVIGTGGVVILIIIVSFVIGSDFYHIFRLFLNTKSSLKHLFRKKCRNLKFMRGTNDSELNIYASYAEDIESNNSNTSHEHSNSIQETNG